jgi:Carboxypeptidase regulatory-like domain
LKTRKILSLLALLVILAPAVFAQSRDTGAITGKVADDQGNALPGVTVTITSPALMGPRSRVTDANGDYRFPALPPGVYALKAELQGFSAAVRENIRVNTTVTLTMDLEMKPTAVAEEVTVVAQSPTVDVKSTETASVTLSNEILRNIPYSQFTSDIVNLAPGVNDNSAYGASVNTGIAYTMDGVNVADPEAGSAWVFLDHNIIEEAKVMGIGLPAEYGNFTGVIFNLVSKSGGNEFSGHMEFDFQGKKSDKPAHFWQAVNNQAYATDWPELTPGLAKLFDLNAHLGGPIKRDKLWFYTGAQYYRSQNYPTGFPEAVDYKQPRWFGKITAQATPTLNFSASLEIDTYNGINRDSGSNVAPNATVNQKSPEAVGNFSLTKIISPKTFFDVKGAFFWGYYYLDPETGMDTYQHFSLDENFRYDSAGYFFYADRMRFQANATLTHYVEDFIAGAHDFKFGTEIERSYVRNRYGYTGKGGPLGDNIVYNDYYGEPYLAYQYEGYDTNTRYWRAEVFAQDAWQVTKRLNINLGLRFSQNWGQVKGVDGNVYTTTRLAPRFGLIFDVFGDKSTIFKAHYGQFTEAMLSSYHDRMNPASAYHDYISYEYIDGKWHEFDRTVHEQLYTMDEEIKHPYLEQVTVGLERELFQDTSISVTYIGRWWKNLIGPIEIAGDYDPINQNVKMIDGTTKSFTIYERTEETIGHYKYLITNLPRAYEDKVSPWILDRPYRKYTGVEVLFNKRFSNRWQFLGSYVYGVAKGTIDNGFADDIGYGGNTYDPNFWINDDGNSTTDPTHMIKIQATYIIPVIDLSVNAYFRGITGDAWAARYRTRTLNQGRVTFNVEPRGSNHYPMEKLLDVRLEKIFTISQKYRLGVLLDVFNVFNTDTITGWGTRLGYDWKYPGASGYPTSSDGHELYSYQRPRQARIGIRLIF